MARGKTSTGTGTSSNSNNNKSLPEWLNCESGQQLLRQLSNQLSSSIISDAIKQVAGKSLLERAHLDDFSFLLALVVSRQADLELVLRRKKNSPAREPSLEAKEAASELKRNLKEDSRKEPLLESQLLHRTRVRFSSEESSTDWDDENEKETAEVKQFKTAKRATWNLDRPSAEAESEKAHSEELGKLSSLSSSSLANLKESKQRKRPETHLGDDCCLLCDGSGSLKLIDNNKGANRSTTRADKASNNIGATASYKCSRELVRVRLPARLGSVCSSSNNRAAGSTITTTAATATTSEQENSVSGPNWAQLDDCQSSWAREQAAKLIYWLLSRKQAPEQSSLWADFNLGAGNFDGPASKYDKLLHWEEPELAMNGAQRQQQQLQQPGRRRVVRERAQNGNEIGNGSSSDESKSGAKKGYNKKYSSRLSSRTSAKKVQKADNNGIFHVDLALTGSELAEIDSARPTTSSASALIEGANQEKLNKEARFNQRPIEAQVVESGGTDVNYFERPHSFEIEQKTTTGQQRQTVNPSLDESEVLSLDSDEPNAKGLPGGDTPLGIQTRAQRGGGDSSSVCAKCRQQTLIPSNGHNNNNNGTSNTNTGSDFNELQRKEKDVEFGPSGPNRNITAKADFNDWLCKLRLERKRLEEQVEFLRDCESRATSLGAAPVPVPVPARVSLPSPAQAPPRPPPAQTKMSLLNQQQSKQNTTNRSGRAQAGNATGTTCGKLLNLGPSGGQVLSSEMQRMKRMDTLKRRRMKRKEEEEELLQTSQPNQTKAGSNSVQFKQHLPARQLNKSGHKGSLEEDSFCQTNESSSGKTVNGASTAGTSDQAPPLASSLIELEEELEEELENEEKLCVGSSTLPKTPQAANFVLRQLNLDDSKKTPTGQQQQQLQRRNRPERAPNESTRTLEDNARQAGQVNLDKGPSKSVTNDALELEQEQLEEEQTAPPLGQNNRRTSAYSYQSLKISISSLVQEVAGQSVKNSKKKFTFNPFANISFSLSPFASPIKRPQTQTTSPVPVPVSISDETKPSNVEAAQVEAEETPRKHSSRSQSSNSRKSTGQSGHNNAGRGSNCSCLKSSSSQSFEETPQGAK